MTYEEYTSYRKIERSHERKRLLEANVLRAEASLELYDVEKEVDKHLPVMTVDEFFLDRDFKLFYAAEQNKLPCEEEVHASTGGDAKRTAELMQIRDAKIKAAWKAKKLSEEIVWE